jgi:hypothetical protein
MTPIYMTAAECVAWFAVAGFVARSDYAVELERWLREREGAVINGMRVVRAGRRYSLEAAI